VMARGSCTQADVVDASELGASGGRVVSRPGILPGDATPTEGIHDDVSALRSTQPLRTEPADDAGLPLCFSSPLLHSP
jgi:hypothetical protein